MNPSDIETRRVQCERDTERLRKFARVTGEIVESLPIAIDGALNEPMEMDERAALTPDDRPLSTLSRQQERELIAKLVKDADEADGFPIS